MKEGEPFSTSNRLIEFEVEYFLLVNLFTGFSLVFSKIRLVGVSRELNMWDLLHLFHDF